MAFFRIFKRMEIQLDEVNKILEKAVEHQLSFFERIERLEGENQKMRERMRDLEIELHKLRGKTPLTNPKN